MPYTFSDDYRYKKLTLRSIENLRGLQIPISDNIFSNIAAIHPIRILRGTKPSCRTAIRNFCQQLFSIRKGCGRDHCPRIVAYRLPHDETCRLMEPICRTLFRYIVSAYFEGGRPPFAKAGV